MSENPVLQLDNITVSYPDGTGWVTPLSQVSIHVNAGELVAITGESGSGKSTLLSVAAGLCVPNGGQVLIHGREVGHSEEERTTYRRDHVGMVFQTPNLLESLNVAEQLEVVGHINGSRAGDISALLHSVGLSGLEKRKITELSGGQRQRVAIARALVSQPAVLLADEPTSALDAKLSRQIVDLLRELTDEFGLATMMVTHDRSQLDIADHVLDLSHGVASS